ncbi:hypothetical protein RNJ44_00219 [Nakaseomyces bracarensis]|uniref:Uncharacterized protein n=1 Tax=Nakaseomyces bracarensis TaxID=273131 RepID=A0ABR4NT84_9SACH
MKLRNIISTAILTVSVNGALLPELNRDIPLNLDDSLMQRMFGWLWNDGEVGESSIPRVNLYFDQSKMERVIPNRYIILFKEGFSKSLINDHMALVNSVNDRTVKLYNDEFFTPTQYNDLLTRGIGIQHEFNIGGLISGYVGYFTEQTVELISKSPIVEIIEHDSIVKADEFQEQKKVPWGLARISQRERLPILGKRFYKYDDQAGSDTVTFVVDTGIYIDHEDFEGRASWGKTIVENDNDEDLNGHGTHCAGTIASKHYGVAKKAEVIAVKVLRSDGSGSMSDVIRGVEYTVEAYRDFLKKRKNFKGAAANMSLGAWKSYVLNKAMDAAVASGVNYAVAAGNESDDACNSSPASAWRPLTVGASTLSEDVAFFSNYGRCVDIFAPGVNVMSTYIGAQNASYSLSGTSMASPHVAGIIAYFLSLQPEYKSQFHLDNTIVSSEVLKKKILHFATNGTLGQVPAETPNRLAFNGAGQNLTDFWTYE